MENPVNYLWLIPLFPLLGALINGAITMHHARRGTEAPRKLVNAIAILMPALSFLVVVFKGYFDLRALDPKTQETTLAVQQTLYTWMDVGGFTVDLAFYFDQLTCLYLSFITFVGTLIHIYSVGYMAHDKGFARYMTYLNLFMFSMIILVLASSLPLMFVGWEGVGLCSYLLIGFWFDDMAKASAGKKAFVVNRIGDFGFVLGMALLFVHFGGVLDYVGLGAAVKAGGPGAGSGMVTAACLLLFLGCCGKSAQLPLYVWLPDAMAGPTPVSALIHAATMVTAGIYLVARMGFLFSLSPTAMGVVATVGAVTALWAAIIGFMQYDIKKVLAYSTVSQLGFMFLAVGVGAFSAGVFHVVTHAFFKACLFLGAGSVIHAMSDEQDIRKMGGLRKLMPVTFWTFLVCYLAIIGIPPFAGFFSKDEILWQVFTTTAIDPDLARLLWYIAMAAAACTAYYMTRLVILTFFGECRADAETKKHVHESPLSMTGPLVVLAVGAAVLGFFGLPNFITHSNSVVGAWLSGVFDFGAAPTHGPEATEKLLMAVSVGVALLGLGVAAFFYWLRPNLPERIQRQTPWLHRVIHNKFYIDELYDAVIIRPIHAFSETVLYFTGDRLIIEGAVNGLAEMMKVIGENLRPIQNGDARVYARWIMIGTLMTIFLIWAGG